MIYPLFVLGAFAASLASISQASASQCSARVLAAGESRLYTSPVSGQTIDLGRAIRLVGLDVSQMVPVLKEKEQFEVFYLNPAGGSHLDPRNAGLSAEAALWMEHKFAAVGEDAIKNAPVAIGKPAGPFGLAGLYFPPYRLESNQGTLYERPYFDRPLMNLATGIRISEEVVIHEFLHHLFLENGEWAPGITPKISQVSLLKEQRRQAVLNQERAVPLLQSEELNLSHEPTRRAFAAFILARIEYIQSEFLMDVFFAENELEVYACHVENWKILGLAANRVESSTAKYIFYLQRLADVWERADSFARLEELNHLTLEQIGIIDPAIPAAISRLEAHRTQVRERIEHAQSVVPTLISVYRKAVGLSDDAPVTRLTMSPE